MKTPSDVHVSAVRRWVHEAPGTDLDAELGRVFRETADEVPLTSAELERVARRFRASRARRSRPVFRLLPVVLAVLTGGAGAALAEWARPDLWVGVHGLFATRSVAPLAASPARSGRAASSAAPLEVNEEPAPASLGDAAVSAPQPAAPSERPPSGRVIEPESSGAQPNQAALESELLQRALEKLRRERDGATALRLLDEYAARFPRGVLSLEAAVARVDALLMLKRHDEALDRLTRLPLSRVGRRTELQLLRAELQAERDCGKALSDFDAVVGAAAPFGERALYGRATCWLRLGNDAAGRKDLQEYLGRYPQGRFAVQVRARLGVGP
jgi:hypothetical protein